MNGATGVVNHKTRRLVTEAQVNDGGKSGRWFLVIKRENGDMVFATRSVQSSATQDKLFRDLELMATDLVLEIFQSHILTPSEFESYCREAYKNLLPKKELPPGAKTDSKDKPKGKPPYKGHAGPPVRKAYKAPVRSPVPHGKQTGGAGS
jgi:hypothetical protein